MKKLSYLTLVVLASLAIVGCAGTRSSSSLGPDCSPNIAWQDKNPDCTGGG